VDTGVLLDPKARNGQTIAFTEGRRYTISLTIVLSSTVAASVSTLCRLWDKLAVLGKLKVKVKVKVKLILVQTEKIQRGNRGIALVFL
jgi:hypothetical protein